MRESIASIFTVDKPINRTSTRVPLWQIDCENLRKAGSFVLENISREENLNFVQEFAAKNGIKWARVGGAVHIYRKGGRHT